MKNIEDLRKFFSEDKYATTAGAYIEEVGENYAKCSMEIKEMHQNMYGAVMGGAYFTLADFAFAVATNSGDTKTVMVNASISYLKPAKGTKLIATAKCKKNGRTNCFYEVEVHDDLNNLVAILSGVGHNFN